MARDYGEGFQVLVVYGIFAILVLSVVIVVVQCLILNAQAGVGG